MEVYLTRQELRRRLRARLGQQTSDTVNSQTIDRDNELLRQAAEHVISVCSWKSLETESYLELLVDQRLVNYPANTGAQDILAVAWWDADAQVYKPILPRAINPILDTEPLDGVGGVDDMATRGEPLYYDKKRTQLEFWPPADQSYDIKVDHTYRTDLNDDVTPCIVDGELILLWALAEVLDLMGEGNAADKKRAQFEVRRRTLKARGAATVYMERGRRRMINLRNRRVIPPPNYDTGPSTI